MEPTEVVDSLRGLVAVADNAFRSTYDFAKDRIDTFMDVKRRDEIRRVATEIQDLAGLLHRLTLVATTFDVEYSRAFDDHHGVRLPKLPQQLFACRHTLIRLQATLSRRKLTYDIRNKEEDFRGRAKLRWPFTTAWTVDLMEEIGRHKEAITKALTSNSMNELLENFSDAKDQHLPRYRDVIRRYMVGRCGYSMEKSAMTRLFLRLGHLEFLMQTLSHRSRWTEYELLEREPVRSWIAGSSNNNNSHHLWIKGGPGVGKTTFAATLIETAIHTHYSDKTTAVAFIFCRFSNPRTHDCFYFLSTLLAQVAVQHPSAMSVLKKYYGELSGRRLVEMPTIERMTPVFYAIAKVFRQILLVIDGADECPDHGDVVTQLMASLVSQSENIRLAVVSDHQGKMEAAFKKTFGESLHCQEYEPSVRHLEMFAATELEKIMVEGNTVFNNPRLKDKVIQKVAPIDDPK
ncbi:hypothetical protein CcaCcLH18_05306 [Colletotrichum camelliae]|nr:hypothetical protein CcaCcLH18_05306 [Colletotrichum camelliae]